MIIADGRKTEGEPTGVGHYERALFDGMSEFADLRVVRGGGIKFHLFAAARVLRNRQSVYFSPESLIVPAIVGRRSLLTIHDLSPLTHPAKHTRRNIFFHKLFLALAARRVGAILVPTAAVRNDVARYLGDRVAAKTRVIHEGVRFSVESILPMLQRKNTVLYVGTIEPRKNVAALCRAFENAQREDSRLREWKLQIVGKRGWLSERETAELEEALAGARAEELGYQPNAAVERLLGDAGIFCYVSEAEGFGLPPLEAMAFGTPIIVSNDAALSEVAGDAGVVIELGSELEQHLRREILRLALDVELRQRLQEIGLRRAAEFSWESAARQTVDVAESLRVRSA